MFSSEQMNVIDYCAQECKRQGSGEASVFHMLDAWDFAYHFKDEKTSTEFVVFISFLGTLVEPQKNSEGFRQIPIFVGNGFYNQEKAKWEDVPRLLEALISSYFAGILKPTHEEAKTAEDQFYYEFENIHPFRDGNGRTGKILYNYLRGTMMNPQMPPNFWGSSNP